MVPGLRHPRDLKVGRGVLLRPPVVLLLVACSRTDAEPETAAADSSDTASDTAALGACTPDTGITCPAGDACGGDLKGDWHVVRVCGHAPSAEVLGDCPTTRAGYSDADADASMHFDADGTMQWEFTTLCGTLNTYWPPECTIGSCEEMSSGMAQAASGWACVAEGEDCVCSGPMTATAGTFEGTWSTTDGSLTLSGSNLPTGGTYCVDGTRASLTLLDDGGFPFDFVLQR